MRILITSAGHLATLLYHELKVEHELRVLRRRPDPAFGEHCVIGDVACYDDVVRAMDGCELVFHTAVRNNTDVELKSYEEFHESNVDGTFNVFLAALRLGVKRVVHSSTCAVTGFYVLPPTDHAVRVGDDAPHRGGDIYGITKIVGEVYADYFRDIHDMSIITLRYGWLAPLPSYQDLAMIYRTLECCFHPQDAVAANLLVMDQTTRGNYLIGTPPLFDDSDAPELKPNPAAVIERRFPEELAYLRAGGFEPRPIDSWIDCSRAIKELGYAPRYDFQDFVRLHRDGAFANQ